METDQCDCDHDFSYSQAPEKLSFGQIFFMLVLSVPAAIGMSLHHLWVKRLK